jgi:hypothetical protein
MLDEQKAAVWAAFERGEMDDKQATIRLLRLDHEHARSGNRVTGRPGVVTHPRNGLVLVRARAERLRHEEWA